MICPIIRFALGRSLDDGRPVAARLRRHLDRCPECAGWLRRQQDLTGLLRRSVPPPPVPSPAVRRRILTEIAAIRRPKKRSLLAPLALPAGAAVAALLTFALLPGPPVDGPVSADRADLSADSRTSGAPDGMVNLLEAAGSLPGLPDGSLFLEAAAGIDGPLQREMHLLKEDARAALLALREDFLPERFLTFPN